MFAVVLFTFPSPEDRGLKGATIAERQAPRLVQWNTIDGIEIQRRVLFVVSTYVRTSP